MLLYLNKLFTEKWKDKDPFKEAEKLDGKVYRNVKNRRTLQFDFCGKSYFLKIHRGIGWREIFKNLTQFKMPILGAKNEFLALKKLHALGIDTMTACAFEIKGINPAKQKSFIITEDLVETISLEDLCKNWEQEKPSSELKHHLLHKIAKITKEMHSNGINHRDYYICHFLAKINDIEKFNHSKNKNIPLYLIDLHRAQIRLKTPYRWRVKDVGGILFSALDIELSKKDYLRFIKLYSGKSIKEELKNNRKFWIDVKQNAVALYKKEFKREADSVI